MRKRLDAHLHREGYFESRELAKAAVMEGIVSVDGRPAMKAGMQVSGDEIFRVERRGCGYVSRGGVKLEYALGQFGLDVGGMAVLDVGSSTGGFTDCLLERGASAVIALDVGRGQLHWKLRNDPRVTVMERFNARNLEPGDLACEPELATIDVSFISLTKVLEPVFGALAEGGTAVALVKPQFEAGRGMVGRGGVVRDPGTHANVMESLAVWMAEREMLIRGAVASPLKGPKGNIEFFVLVSRGIGPVISPDGLRSVVARAHGLEE